jgi:regulation of enolase protein 1 (concanavalin A-like superfamily)
MGLTENCRPGTDLWRKPSRDTFTAPVLYTSAPLHFFRAEVTVHIRLTSAFEWDQGGLVIFAGPLPVTTSATAAPVPNQPPAGKWVKAGIEYYDGRTTASSVSASSDGADWSLVELPVGVNELKVRFERVDQALWIWFDDGFEWKKLREVTWFFYGVDEKNVRIGVYASRPANFMSGRSLEELVVEFEGLEIY